MPVRKRKKRESKMTDSERHDFYFMAARLSVLHNETDQLVRTIMASAMASQKDIIPGTVLAQDLTLLRWVLRKMQENRMIALSETQCETTGE